jgi:hypothetical protein
MVIRATGKTFKIIRSARPEASALGACDAGARGRGGANRRPEVGSAGLYGKATDHRGGEAAGPRTPGS